MLGKNTLQALQRPLPGYQHRVRLHFRSIALPKVGYERSLLDAQVVYGQYGIKIEFASGESLMLTPTSRSSRCGAACAAKARDPAGTCLAAKEFRLTWLPFLLSSQV